MTDQWPLCVEVGLYDNEIYIVKYCKAQKMPSYGLLFK